MKILKTARSFEACTEAGWLGYDFYLELPADRDFLDLIAPLGELTFMPKLKKPFFIIRSDKFMIRGVFGDSRIKIGIAGGDKAVLERVIEAIAKTP